MQKRNRALIYVSMDALGVVHEIRPGDGEKAQAYPCLSCFLACPNSCACLQIREIVVSSTLKTQ